MTAVTDLADLAEQLAYTHAETIDGEWGCCHSAEALRAGGRAPEYDGDVFEPVPVGCPGMGVLNEWLPRIGELRGQAS